MVRASREVALDPESTDRARTSWNRCSRPRSLDPQSSLSVRSPKRMGPESNQPRSADPAAAVPWAKLRACD